MMNGRIRIWFQIGVITGIRNTGLPADSLFLCKSLSPSILRSKSFIFSSLWKSWYTLEESARVVLESQLKDPAKGCISWEKYQDLAGNVLLGTLDDRIG